MTQIWFQGNEAATQEGLRERGIDSAKTYLIAACMDEFQANPARVTVSARKPAQGKFSVESGDGLRFDATMQVKILGDQHGGIVLFNFGALFAQIHAAGTSTGKA